MEHLTDSHLRANIERKRGLALPTRYDSIMLSIHPDDRQAASLACGRFLNMSTDAGRPSDALRLVSRDFRKAAA
jgi:hypothetical protein